MNKDRVIQYMKASYYNYNSMRISGILEDLKRIY